jgi:uncharacterized oligopeptide transporter (OPT) family protein
VGIIPAFSIMSPEDNPPDGALKFSPGQLLLWSTALAFFGVFMAVPLREQTIVREKLKFPSGTATASVIATLHGATMKEEGGLFARQWQITSARPPTHSTCCIHQPHTHNPLLRGACKQ